MSDTYTTISGDTWDIISYNVFGSAAHTGALMSLNPQHVETVFFPAGVLLMLPEEVVPEAEDLPPWKRGDPYEQ